MVKSLPFLVPLKCHLNLLVSMAEEPHPHFAPAPIDLISIGTTPDLVLYMEHAMLRV